MEQNSTYEQAYKELEVIAREMESQAVPIDVLAEKVKRAAELITYCETKLRSTEAEVNKIIAQMDKQQ